MLTILQASVGLLGHWSYYLFKFCWVVSSHGFEHDLCADNPQTDISMISPALTSCLTPDSYIQFLLEFFIRISNRHLKLSIPQTEFLYHPFQPVLPLVFFISVNGNSFVPVETLESFLTPLSLKLNSSTNPVESSFKIYSEYDYFILFAPLLPSSWIHFHFSSGSLKS